MNIVEMNSNSKREVLASHNNAPVHNFVAIDAASIKGQFGWITIDCIHIPYIYRHGEKFCCVKIVEVAFLDKYIRLFKNEFYSAVSIESYYMTAAESQLFDDINQLHCDKRFGNLNFNRLDIIVKLSDVQELFQFITFCHKRLTIACEGVPEKCGFVCISGSTIIPYIIINDEKLLPTFYFDELPEQDIDIIVLLGWNWAYLKFCSKVQGIKEDLIPASAGSVVRLNEIIDIFPGRNTFEFCWPCPVMSSKLLVTDIREFQIVKRWLKVPTPTPLNFNVHLGPSQSNGNISHSAVNESTSMSSNITPSYRPSLPPAREQNKNVSQSAPNHASTVTTQISRPIADISQRSSAIALNNMQQDYQNLTLTEKNTNSCIEQNESPPVKYSQKARNAVKQPHTSCTVPSTVNSSVHNLQQYSQTRMPNLQPIQNAAQTIRSVAKQPLPSRKRPLHPLTDETKVNLQNFPGRKHLLPPVTDVRKVILKNIPVPPARTNEGSLPFRAETVFVQGKPIKVVNMIPYTHSEKIVSVAHLQQTFFPTICLSSVTSLMQSFGLELFRGNFLQTQVLLGRTFAYPDTVPLIRLRDALRYISMFLEANIGKASARKQIRLEAYTD